MLQQCVREKRVPKKEGESCGDQIYDSIDVFSAKDGINNFSNIYGERLDIILTKFAGEILV